MRENFTYGSLWRGMETEHAPPRHPSTRPLKYTDPTGNIAQYDAGGAGSERDWTAEDVKAVRDIAKETKEIERRNKEGNKKSSRIDRIIQGLENLLSGGGPTRLDANMADLLNLAKSKDGSLSFDEAEKIVRTQEEKTWENILVGVLISRGGSGNKGAAKTEIKILGKGSTGRTVANNLKEQLAMKEVMSNPLDGAKQLKSVTMNDKRWLAEDGWVKMSKTVNGVEIHYVYNTKTGAFDDFKFK